MNTNEIIKMSVAERIDALEAIWDSLMIADAKIESPDWHQDVLAERRARLRDPSAKFVSLADLKIGNELLRGKRWATSTESQ
ncbi:addiction module protein [uncultured Lamprocystis sp.]|jgi:hypothetical protein|uniref:addiction module protein n=2 Tax=uncultured Lamprocystis sp. TaxID=543132 RepID=UPI0025D4FED2|nr:addiction module protein [uncultured Lamprocystis sp.]